jgi:hypothetical protein
MQSDTKSNMSSPLEDASKSIEHLIRLSNMAFVLDIDTVPESLVDVNLRLNSEECRDLRPYEKCSLKPGRVPREYMLDI